MELDAKRTAVIAVHFQHDIVSPDGAFGGFFADQAKKHDVVGTTKTLLDGARSSGALVVYTRVAYKAGHADLVANSALLKLVAESRCLLDGSAKAEIIPELTPKEGDLVVTHQRVGGFAASPLDTLLRSRGIDTVLLCGVATNFSVEATARQAADLGYRAIVISDACSTANEAAHEASIGTLGLLLAEVAKSTDAVGALKAGK